LRDEAAMTRADPALADAVETALGRRPTGARPLPGGCIAEVLRLDFDAGDPVVAKRAPRGGLETEAFMLSVLAERSELPVPALLHADDTLLVMQLVPGRTGLDASAQDHAAHHVAALHRVRGPAFGLERDTLIGPLHQPNAQGARWIDFFRDQRLLYAADRAQQAGNLSAGQRRTLDRLAGKLAGLLEEPAHPALLHGDMWTGNVLAERGRVTGFVDPAVYYGHPEIELAFATLFGTFGEPFFKRYAELAELRPGFFEARRDLYNLYPLLVHATLFSGGYAAQATRIAERFA
jgi:fructosamine-3-kinase